MGTQPIATSQCNAVWSMNTGRTGFRHRVQGAIITAKAARIGIPALAVADRGIRLTPLIEGRLRPYESRPSVRMCPQQLPQAIRQLPDRPLRTARALQDLCVLPPLCPDPPPLTQSGWHGNPLIQGYPIIFRSD